MTDPSSVYAAMQALKTASDIIKGLRTADLSLEKAELKLRLADLAEQLVNARVAVLDAQQAIQELQLKVTELETAEDLTARLEFRKNAYFLKTDAGSDDGPFCLRCFDADKKLIHLSHLEPGFGAAYICANCKGTF